MRDNRRFTGLIATAAVVLGAGGVSAAASSFETGDYAAGKPKTGAGVRMHIGAHRFSVKVIRYREQCKYGDKSFSEFVAFRRDAEHKLGGKVQDDGDFSGKYVDNYGNFKVSGHVEGDEATVKSTESGIYNPASTKHPNRCEGSHTFHAKLVDG